MCHVSSSSLTQLIFDDFIQDFSSSINLSHHALSPIRELKTALYALRVIYYFALNMI
ncbi:hypothetical protein HanXRQr2_Chr14g0667511 [Helianthus annuus]|uniref:Uncharacterized protein n=1 Tax=Helianthus annuus TaxID=4232 RepID=A0A9K3EDQ5_HELAN|nr:hypothetical protein HanXRQr2_Chr14g0667511 [Helianthus annuus]